MVRVGETCQGIANEMMHALPCKRVEVDEIWCYVGKKQRHVSDNDDPYEVGDFWTWVALDAETKLVPSYLVAKRDAASARAFMVDLRLAYFGFISHPANLLRPGTKSVQCSWRLAGSGNFAPRTKCHTPCDDRARPCEWAGD